MKVFFINVCEHKQKAKLHGWYWDCWNRQVVLGFLPFSIPLAKQGTRARSHGTAAQWVGLCILRAGADFHLKETVVGLGPLRCCQARWPHHTAMHLRVGTNLEVKKKPPLPPQIKDAILPPPSLTSLFEMHQFKMKHKPGTSPWDCTAFKWPHMESQPEQAVKCLNPTLWPPRGTFVLWTTEPNFCKSKAWDLETLTTLPCSPRTKIFTGT